MRNRCADVRRSGYRERHHHREPGTSIDNTGLWGLAGLLGLLGLLGLKRRDDRTAGTAATTGHGTVPRA
jgi:hypothetical protein